MSGALATITTDIYDTRDAFENARVIPTMKFEAEAGFAIQVLSKSDYALKLASSNRQSVVDAVTNVAAIGISLNPAKKQAYLVPRDGKICLDISWMGLIDLAVDCGSILWAQANIVYANENFQINGFDKQPTHKRDPFSKNKGEIVGAYVVAKTRDGDYITEAMSLEELHDVRNRSSAWKAWIEKKKVCPWVTDETEMMRKTVVKRGSKYWPRVNNDDRLQKAIDHLNTDGEEGLVGVNRNAAPAAEDAPIFDCTAWIEKANAAKTEDELRTIWMDGQAASSKARDVEGGNAFKRVVNARKRLLNGKASAADAEVKE